jgi:hypothetical protein
LSIPFLAKPLPSKLSYPKLKAIIPSKPETFRSLPKMEVTFPRQSELLFPRSLGVLQVKEGRR